MKIQEWLEQIADCDLDIWIFIKEDYKTVLDWHGYMDIWTIYLVCI